MTCHVPSAGWSVTPRELQKRFAATNGTEAIFRPSDGANAPGLDLSTVPARSSGYSLLLEKGLIRMHSGPPANAEFSVVQIDDPYGYATPTDLSLYRRPLPATNVRFLNDVMWDGRHTLLGQPLPVMLAAQARDAARQHEDAASPLPDSVVAQIVAFELSLTTAESQHAPAGALDHDGAGGGAVALAARTGPTSASSGFRLFEGWSDTSHTAYQRAVATGEELFNSRFFNLPVNGLPGTTGLVTAQVTCSTCHNGSMAGNHSTPLLVDTGVADAAIRSSDVPLYTLRNNQSGERTETTDPGLSLVTGRWNDVGKFKVPVLRGLASRPPYFHNGAAANLLEAIVFYERRSDLRLSATEKTDLVEFLNSL